VGGVRDAHWGCRNSGDVGECHLLGRYKDESFFAATMDEFLDEFLKGSK